MERVLRRVAVCALLLLPAACVRGSLDAGPTPRATEAVTPVAPVLLRAPQPRFEMVPGTTLRETLERWAASSGWTVRWASDRAYPVKGRAMFDGDFVQAAGDLIRSFRHLDPPPIARFYMRNRELRVVTPGDEMGE